METASYPLQIAVSGTKGGTGNSTLTETLANQYNIPRYSASIIRRGLALAWQAKLTTSPLTNLEAVWQEFADQVNQGIEQQNQLIAPHLHQNCPEHILNKFNQTATKLSPDNDWDLLPEKIICSQLAGKSGVVDGKLAIALDLLDPITDQNFQKALESVPALAIPLIRILLDVDPDTAAQRLFQRDCQRPPTASAKDQSLLRTFKQQNQKRIKGDWLRYSQAYHFKPTSQPITQENLNQVPDLATIDTTSLNPIQVCTLALHHIRSVLNSTNDRPGIEPSKLSPWINLTLTLTDSSKLDNQANPLPQFCKNSQ